MEPVGLLIDLAAQFITGPAFFARRYRYRGVRPPEFLASPGAVLGLSHHCQLWGYTHHHTQSGACRTLTICPPHAVTFAQPQPGS